MVCESLVEDIQSDSNTDLQRCEGFVNCSNSSHGIGRLFHLWFEFCIHLLIGQNIVQSRKYEYLTLNGALHIYVYLFNGEMFI